MGKNIMYLPPCEVVAAGTNRNIMQAGMKTSTVEEEIQRLRAEIAHIKRQKSEILADFGEKILNQPQPVRFSRDEN